VGIALTIPTLSHAQSCASAAGNWTDNFGFRWNLSQNSAGQISGTVDGTGIITQCPNPVFSVSGNFSGSGNFLAVATNPNPPGNAFCVPNFTYDGSINRPGCNTGNGTFTNLLGSGPWDWSKPCEIPTSETTTAVGWNVEESPTLYDWRGTLQPTTTTFGGRTVVEVVRRADFCLAASRGEPVTIDTFTISANVNTNNSYIDVVGYPRENVDIYRQQGVTPCNFTANQTLFIDCATPGPMFFFNQLGAEITPTTVSSSRAGQTRTRIFE
jgi:hypothetical protein